jgi:hypothetical protein
MKNANIDCIQEEDENKNIKQLKSMIFKLSN